MKDTGKTIKGVKVYTSPDCPPGILYAMTGIFLPRPKVVPELISHEEKQRCKELGSTLYRHFIALRPRRSGTLTEAEDE